jgi:hypothetical protein
LANGKIVGRAPPGTHHFELILRQRLFLTGRDEIAVMSFPRNRIAWLLARPQPGKTGTVRIES